MGSSGKKFYGVFYPKTNEYFACVKLDENHKDDMELERAVIPGGKYAKKKIKNWMDKIHEISSEFDSLKQACIKNGYEIDETRPSIEFYKRLDELVIMVPVK